MTDIMNTIAETVFEKSYEELDELEQEKVAKMAKDLSNKLSV